MTSALESAPSKTAVTTALLRALANADSDFADLDPFAHLFLDLGYQALVNDPKRRHDFISELNPGAYGYLIARTRLIDKCLTEFARRTQGQVVILGAGFDSRAFRFQAQLQDTKIFELDMHATQHWKRLRLNKFGYSIPPNTTYVATSFNLQQLASELTACGFNSGIPTLFIWEGVTPYLSQDHVMETLRVIRSNSAPGSELVFDYLFQAALMGEDKFDGFEKVNAWALQSGEPFKFGADPAYLGGLLSTFGYTEVTDYSPAQLEALFLTLNGQQASERTTGFYGIVHALYPP